MDPNPANLRPTCSHQKASRESTLTSGTLATWIAVLTSLSVSTHAATFQAISAKLDPALESCLPGNGAIDPGETNTVLFTFLNTGDTRVRDLRITLNPSVNNVAFAVHGPVSVKEVPPHASFAVPFRFRANGICGGILDPRFSVDGTESDGTPFSNAEVAMPADGPFEFRLGAVAQAIYSSSNLQPIQIPDLTLNPNAATENGRAIPYPSSLEMVGIPHESGRTGERVSRIAVILRGVSHTYSADLGIVLQSPNGHRIMLMRNAGGRVFPNDTGMTNVTLIFDSTATEAVPPAAAIGTGSYRPADYSSGDLIPRQFPSPPYLTSLDALIAPSPGIPATDSELQALDPNGRWQLFIVDSVQGDTGIVSGGWVLEIQTSRIVCCGDGNTHPTIELGDGFEPTATSPNQGNSPTTGDPDSDSSTPTDDSDTAPPKQDNPQVPTDNQQPRITLADTLEIAANAPSQAFPIRVEDTETPATQLRLTVDSSNPLLIPNSNILFAGEGSERQVVIVPAMGQSGQTTLTFSVSDANGAGMSATLRLTVRQPSPSPEIPPLFPGFAELIFQNEEGYLAGWKMDGTSLRSANLMTPDHLDDPGFRIAGTADLNQDGSRDLVFQKDDGTLAFWLMHDNLQFRTGAFTPQAPSDKSWRLAAIGDLDRDNTADLIFQHTDRSIAVWFLTDTVLSRASLLSPTHADPGWTVVGTGDFNQDSWMDILFQRTDGMLAVWQMQGTQLLSAILLNPSAPGSPEWRVVSTTDLNRDGNPDLIFQHATATTLAVWFMNRTDLISAQLLDPPIPGGSWKIVAP